MRKPKLVLVLKSDSHSENASAQAHSAILSQNVAEPQFQLIVAPEHALVDLATAPVLINAYFFNTIFLDKTTY